MGRAAGRDSALPGCHAEGGQDSGDLVVLRGGRPATGHIDSVEPQIKRTGPDGLAQPGIKSDLEPISLDCRQSASVSSCTVDAGNQQCTMKLPAGEDTEDHPGRRVGQSRDAGGLNDLKLAPGSTGDSKSSAWAPKRRLAVRVPKLSSTPTSRPPSCWLPAEGTGVKAAGCWKLTTWSWEVCS